MNKMRKLRMALVCIYFLFVVVMFGIGTTTWQLLCNPGKSYTDEICILSGLAVLSYLGGTLHGYTVRRIDAEKEERSK